MMPFDKNSDNRLKLPKSKGPSGRQMQRLMWIAILAALVMLLLPGYSEAANITKKWGECTSCDYKSVTEDSYIDSTTNTNNFGAYETVYVGRKGTATGDDRTYRGLIKFNFSNIPISNASQIISAKLWVYMAGNEGSGNIVDAYRVLKSWNQGNKSNGTGTSNEVTWRCQSYPTQWSAWGCDGSGTDREAAVAASTSINFNNTWFSFDVTSSAQAMFTSGQYYGWLLKRNTEPDAKNRVWFYSSNYTGDASKRPYLEITYSDSSQLKVEPNSLSMVGAETKAAVVSGGSPGYTVSSSNPSVATAGINGTTIIVTAVGQGSATITVRDSTNASVTIAVTVTAPLAVSPANLSLFPPGTATVTVSGGSPGYTVVSGNPAIAQASIAGSTVTVTAVGGGAITVTVTDAANHHAYVVVNVGATITPGLGTCPSPPFASTPMGPNVMIMFDTSGSMNDTDGDAKSRFQEAKEAVFATLDANPNVRFGLTRMDGTGWKYDPRPGGLVTAREALKGGRVLVPCGFKGPYATSAEYVKWYIQTYMSSVDQMRTGYGVTHNTNLAGTLADIGRYFATVLDGIGNRVGKGPAGFGHYKEGTDYTYYYDKNNDTILDPFQAQSTDDVGNTIDTTSPIQYSCEKSFVVMFTDGLANTDNNWSLVTDVIGDYDGDHDSRDCKRAAPTVIRPDVTNYGDTNYGIPLWNATYPCDTREVYMKNPTDPAHWEEPGEANYLDDVAKYLYEQDLRSDIPGVQNLITYTIGFYADNSLLRSAAEKGGGKYFTASSLSQLTDALQKAMEDIMLKIASGTAVSTITTSSSTDDYLIRARFLPGNSWRGYLERFTLPYDGDDPDYHADWDAGTLLKNRVAANGHTDRKIYTYMSSQDPHKREFKDADPVKSRMKSLWGTSDSETQDMINYLRGDTTYDSGKYKNRAGGLLGDIIYSTPIALGAPKGWYIDRPAIVDPPEYASYQAFKTTNRLRKTMIYVGANDGMLHAFDAGTGQEDWAFIPENVQGKLKDLTVGGCHKYYVDLTPYITDAWFGDDEDDVDTAHGSDWKTVLIGGNRFGGEEYFALDVTNPAYDQFDALWDVIPFSGKLSSTIPVVGKVKADDGDVDHWVAFVTSGYHAGTDPGAVAALKVKNGHKKYIWRKDNGDYTDTCTTQAKGSRVAGRNYYTMSSPAALDSDLDGYLDLVYAGDTEGSLWKFYYDYEADSWKKVELFNTGGQAITATPALAFDSDGNLRIYFGTGKYLEESDKADSTRNAFYCLVEHKQYPGNANNGHFTSATTISKLNLASLTTAVSQAQFDALAQATRTNATANGWYFELDVPSSFPAERVLERALVVSNTVFLTTFVPNQDVCGYGGSARLYEVNYINGVSDPVILTQLVAGKRYADIGVGIPSEPVYYFDPSTKKPRILIQKSDANIEDPQPILQERPMRVRSWKDG